MDLVDYVRMAQDEPPLRFLIIGGYAVAAHGYVRATFDVDFLAEKDKRENWIKRFGKSGLHPRSSNEVFVQFVAKEGDESLDLMFVQLATFDQMWTDSQEKVFGQVRAHVPSLDHLLALKLHALNLSLQHRFSKDAGDVEMLIRKNGVNIDTTHYRTLFLKHANLEIYETFLRILKNQ